MSTHNICFCGEMQKMIPGLLWSCLLVRSTAESYNQKSRCLVASYATVVQSFVCKSPI